MRVLSLFTLATSLLLLIGFREIGYACSCFGTTPCEGYKTAAIVFVGRVVGVDDTPYRGVRYTFEIERLFKGGNAMSVTVESETWGCGYHFDNQQAYLVYATRTEQGSFYTDKCYRTRPLSKAAFDLEYLRRVPNSLDASFLAGRISQMVAIGDIKPVAGLKIVAERDTGSYETVTDTAGMFCYVGLPAGSYTFRYVLPAHMVPVNRMSNEARINDGGCTEVDIQLVPTGVVAGRVSDSAGRSMSDVMVELAPWDSLADNSYIKSLHSISDSSGIYSIDKIPPGKYLLGVNIRRAPRGSMPYPVTFFPGGSGCASGEGAFSPCWRAPRRL